MTRAARIVAGILLTLIVLIGLVWVLWLRDSESPAEQTVEAECFKVGYLDITASAPLFIAQNQDLFSAHGVCVITERFATSNQLVDALAANRIDYVVETSAVPALALQLRSPGRFYITAASTISTEEPFDAIIVPETSHLSSLADLAGKRIAVFPGTTARNLLANYMSSQGIDVSKTEFIPTPPQNLLASVKSGAVDAAHVYEPAWTIAKSDPTLKELYGTVYGRQLSPNPQGVSLLNARTLKVREVEARNLVQAFDAALDIMRYNDDVARGALAAHFELPGSTVQDMNLLYMQPSDELHWESLQAYASLLVDVGELERVPPLESARLE